MPASPLSFTGRVSADGQDYDAVLTLTPVVAPDPAVQTTTLLTASEYEIVQGESVTLTASVTPAGAAGSVAFYDADDVHLGTVALVDGQASITVPASELTVGTRAFDAEYSSTDVAKWLDSESDAVTVTVTAPPPMQSTISLSLSPAAPVVGQELAITATALPAVAGTMVFKSGSYTIGTYTTPNGVAVHRSSSFPAATHNITATFTPSNLSGSTAVTSALFPVTVAPAPTTPPATNLTVPAKVKIGTAELALSSVNPTSTTYPGGRGADEIVAYSGITSTATNQYGVEVQISGGKVVAVNDRLTTGSTTGTSVPANGYVLSAHGTARDWLLPKATVGTTVELYDATGTRTYWQSQGTSTTPTPEPEPTPTGKVMSYWHLGYRGPTWAEIPADIKAKVTDWSVAMATSASSGTGNIQWSPTNESADTFKAGVAELRAAGKNVILGIGGSAGGGITVNSTATVGQFVSSIKSLCSTYGFNGIDIDLEPASSSWTTDHVAQAARQLIADLPGFKVVVTTGLYSTYTAKWMDLCQKIGHDKYHYTAPMLYDFPEAGDSRLSGVAVQKCDVMAAAGVPQNKMVLGYMPRPTTSYANSTPDVAIMNAATAAVKAKYPQVRGVFLWEDAIDREQGSAGMPGPAWKYGRGIVLP